MSDPIRDPLYGEKYEAPKLLGGIFNWFFYGVLVVQFYVYSYNFPRDSRHIKLLVYSIFFLETIQTVLNGADLFYWFALGFDELRPTAPFASFFDLQILGSVVSLSVQFFFVYRIRELSRLSEKRSRWLVCVIICLLSVIGALGSFTAGIMAFKHRLWGSALQITEITWIVANTLSDLLITSAMLYYLRRVWARDSYLSNHVLVKIVRLTVETNLVTTSVSIVTLLMVAVYPYTLYYLCPAYVLGKLYSNTLLVSLNNRISTRDAYEARGVVIDRQVMTVSDVPRSEATMHTIILEAVKPQEDLMKQPAAEFDVEERVKSSETVDV